MKAVSIEKTILNVAEAHDVIGKSLSLAVSGGPDSMAMAHALIENQKEMASNIGSETNVEAIGVQNPENLKTCKFGNAKS